MELAVRAITAGIINDTMSGNNVDLCVLRKGYRKFYRNYKSIGKKLQLR